MLIALLGEVMLGRLVNERLRRVAAGYPWGDTIPVLGTADLTVANLECVLAAGGRPEPGKVFHFRSDPGNVASLRSAGIGMVSLANNHVLDYGESAFREMLPTLDSAGILHAGAGLEREAARRPAVRRVAGTGVGLIAFTDNEPGWEAGRGPGVFYAPVTDKDSDPRVMELLALVRRTRARVQLLIVSAHWGPNWGNAAPPEHRALGRALIEAGADVVYGHSPHVVRGIEVFRDRPILYSTGDFVDDYAVDPQERNDQSFIFLLESDGGTPRTLRLHPTVISEFQARLAGGSSGQIAQRMQRLNRQLGTASSWNADGGFLEIPLSSPG
jgi:poly-gamma-glutamate capsule biosynthesis protein CapA/YwtB (metallophosphatase superfamily)